MYTLTTELFKVSELVDHLGYVIHHSVHVRSYITPLMSFATTGEGQKERYPFLSLRINTGKHYFVYHISLHALSCTDSFSSAVRSDLDSNLYKASKSC